nr:hypothetical protein OH837_39660 [Streptomyces canus]
MSLVLVRGGMCGGGAGEHRRRTHAQDQAGGEQHRVGVDDQARAAAQPVHHQPCGEWESDADIGTRTQDGDAETAPLEHPEYYRYDLDVPRIAEVWRRGSVVRSWLLDLTAAALRRSPDLEDFAGRVSDSGEGRWTTIAAIDEGVPAPVLTAALYSRFASRQLDEFADKTLSAMRKQFGGHDEKRSI